MAWTVLWEEEEKMRSILDHLVNRKRLEEEEEEEL